MDLVGAKLRSSTTIKQNKNNCPLYGNITKLANMKCDPLSENLPFLLIPQISSYCFSIIQDKQEQTTEVSAFVMGNLAVTALESWNYLYLDLYINNQANKLQVLNQSTISQGNKLRRWDVASYPHHCLPDLSKNSFVSTSIGVTQNKVCFNK